MKQLTFFISRHLRIGTFSSQSRRDIALGIARHRSSISLANGKLPRAAGCWQARNTSQGNGEAIRAVAEHRGDMPCLPARGCNDPSDLCPVRASAWPCRYQRDARPTDSRNGPACPVPNPRATRSFRIGAKRDRINSKTWSRKRSLAPAWIRHLPKIFFLNRAPKSSQSCRVRRIKRFVLDSRCCPSEIWGESIMQIPPGRITIPRFLPGTPRLEKRLSTTLLETGGPKERRDKGA